MGCHVAGKTVSVSLAAHAAGVRPRDAAELYESLALEADGIANPSVRDVLAWVDRQDLLLSKARMSADRKDALRRALDSTPDQAVPDGEQFYAQNMIEARTRQHRIVTDLEDRVTALADPGSQADRYPLGPDGRPSHIWYASYGSNLNDERLMTYIAGGTPPGGSRRYDGCDDQRPPADDIAIRLQGYRPHFAMRSRVWQGGIAFVDRTDNPDDYALGRAYLITIDQYDQIVAQENGRPSRLARPVDLRATLTDGVAALGDGAYETNHHVGDHLGLPVVTFTAPFTVNDALNAGSRPGDPFTNKPSAAYCRMIGEGLHRTFGLTEVEQADYIRGCPGGHRWARQDLVRALRAQPPARPTFLSGLPTEPPTRAPSPPGDRSTARTGDRWPSVKTYTTRADQHDGIKRWENRLAVATARRDTAQVDHSTATGIRQKDTAAALRAAERDVAEATEKLERARDQAPTRWFAADSRTSSQWTAYANDLEDDLLRARRALARPDSAPDVTAAVDRLSAQLEEARSYAERRRPRADVRGITDRMS